MPNSWRQTYTELTDFMAKNPTIEIGKRVVSIPGDVRPEFYRLFSAVRTALVEEKFPDFRKEAMPLSENYLKAEREVIKLLGLENISLPTFLHRFLHDPNEGLSRGLFIPLFDLLKGKVDIEAFEQKALRDTEQTYGYAYWLGYQKWVVLSLVKLLEADEPLQVFLDEPSPEARIILRYSPDEMESPVPPPQETKSISFNRWQEMEFIVPDLIMHSAKINQYVSLISEIGEALSRASNVSEEREWLNLDSIATLDTDLVLIYVADKPEEISLIADAEKICRPDLVIKCREQKDWYEKEGMERLKLHHSALKPTLGTYVVSREPVPQQNLVQPREDINILTAGFNQTKLEPLISILTKDKGPFVECDYGKS